MSKIIGVFYLIFCSALCFSQQVSGIIIDEDQNPVPVVLVFNMKTEQKSYTNLNGEFSIKAAPNEELRFIRQGFQRNSKMVDLSDFNGNLLMTIIRSVQEIEEVKIPAVRLTGDLNQDSRYLTKFDKVAQLQREVGVPGPPLKPREKPSELGKNVLLPLIGIPPTVNVQAIYNVVSGKAKRQKRLYKYEDLQDNIIWIRGKVGDDYFIKMEIPPEKIPEFLQFSIGVKPEISKYIKAGKLSKVLLVLEDTLPQYLRR